SAARCAWPLNRTRASAAPRHPPRERCNRRPPARRAVQVSSSLSRMETVAIVDYGMSNLRSVEKALAFVAGRQRIVVTDRPEEIRAADRLVFPGQGAIGACMTCLDERGLQEAVRECARNRPYLGICLGQQCLLSSSEEDGGTP